MTWMVEPITQRGLVLVDDRGDAFFCPATSAVDDTDITVETASGLDEVTRLDSGLYELRSESVMRVDGFMEATEALPLAWATTEVDADVTLDTEAGINPVPQ